jgi:hypothetical protein
VASLTLLRTTRFVAKTPKRLHPYTLSSVEDPLHFGTDPHPDLRTDPAPVPALFVSDLQDANKKKILSVRFFC